MITILHFDKYFTFFQVQVTYHHAQAHSKHAFRQGQINVRDFYYIGYI